jgi:hypothetical protein
MLLLWLGDESFGFAMRVFFAASLCWWCLRRSRARARTHLSVTCTLTRTRLTRMRVYSLMVAMAAEETRVAA